MQERDFKGVWIPKEVWFNRELSVTDRCLLAEIDSLDGETQCFATNEYFAEFFNVSEATIKRSIAQLKKLGLIETEMQTTKTGTQRIIKVVHGGCGQNDQRGCGQNDQRGVVKMTTIYNNSNNINVLSKDNTPAENFKFGEPKPKKKNLYQSCADLIDNWTNIDSIRNLLFQYLDLCMEMQSIRGANQWKGMLNTLEKVQQQCHPHTFEEIIQLSIEHGWKTFYPIKDNFSGKKFDEFIRDNNDTTRSSNEPPKKSSKEF